MCVCGSVGGEGRDGLAGLITLTTQTTAAQFDEYATDFADVMKSFRLLYTVAKPVSEASATPE